MKRHIPPAGRAEVTVPAPVESVWSIVSDVTRTGEWSHECQQVTWLDGAASAMPGVRFRGRNRSGPWRWSRVCEVLAVDPPYSISWRTIPTWRYVDSTDWEIVLTPVEGGTRIAQTFDVTRCPAWWEWLASRLVTAHLDRSGALTADLVRIGEVAASPLRRRSDRSSPRGRLGRSRV